MIKFLRRFIFSFNIIAVILLLGSYASVFISPKEAWIFAFLGLAYPIFLFINILFALFWLVQFKLTALFSIVTIFIGIPFFNQSFKFSHNIVEADTTISIVTYNAGLFGYFQGKWSSIEFMDKVSEISPDILCVQELLNIKSKNTSTVDSILKNCKFTHVYFHKLEDGRKKGEYGIAIFSKFRIIEKHLVNFDGATGNMCVYADLQLKNNTFRVYNTHLQSFKFRKQDYKFIEQMPEDNDEKIRQSKNILNRMKWAYIKRSEQVLDIRANIVKSAFPYFVVGDFNDPPVSYSYATLSRGLKDAFVENGFGMGKTYIGIMPNFRIDYILYPDNFTGLDYKTYKLSSDHSLVETSISIAEN